MTIYHNMTNKLVKVWKIVQVITISYSSKDHKQLFHIFDSGAVKDVMKQLFTKITLSPKITCVKSDG